MTKLTYAKTIINPSPKPQSKDQAYRIALTDNFYTMVGKISGSYNVCLARIFGLSYLGFLLMIKEKYGATLRGKNSKYIAFSFDDEIKAKKCANLINDRINLIVKESEM